MKNKQILFKNIHKIGTDRQTKVIFLVIICLFSVNLFGQNRLLKPASTLFNLTQENATTYICPIFVSLIERNLKKLNGILKMPFNW